MQSSNLVKNSDTQMQNEFARMREKVFCVIKDLLGY